MTFGAALRHSSSPPAQSAVLSDRCQSKYSTNGLFFPPFLSGENIWKVNESKQLGFPVVNSPSRSFEEFNGIRTF